MPAMKYVIKENYIMYTRFQLGTRKYTSILNNIKAMCGTMRFQYITNNYDFVIW